MNSAESRMAELIVENGRHKGQHVLLRADEPCVIGANGDATAQLTDAGVAPRHAVVKALKDGGFGVKSLEGVVLVNGAKTRAARLRGGDVVDLGGTRLRFAEGATAEEHAEPSDGLQPDTMLGGFRILEEIGRGGMGTVYRAEQVSLGREVALKVLEKALTRDPVFVARFVAEARAAARLHHPNVVQVFDVDHDGDTYYYSMELMHNGSLERLLKSRGKLSVEEATQVVLDAARGLAYAESLRIVHRDIKPDNLMLDQHGHVKIADLGLALTDEDDQTKLVGTPHFMSPEQVLRRKLDHRSDLYSLGCTYYRLLTGRTPFRGNTVKEILRAHVKETPEPPSRVCPELPAEVDAIVEKLLRKDPDERYASAQELIEDLERVVAPPARKGLWVGGITVALLLAGMGLAYGLTRPEGKTRTVKEIVENPANRELLERNRQLRAQVAYLEVLARDLDDTARAAALEKVATAHPGTDYGERARREAQALRARIAAAEEARRRHEQRVANYLTGLRSRVEEALAAAPVRAHGVLEELEIDPELAREPRVVKELEVLRRRVREAAAAELQRRRAKLREATQSEDPEKIEGAAAHLAALVEGAAAWPEDLLGDPAEIRKELAQARSLAAKFRAAARAAAEARAWQRLAAAFGGREGLLTRLERLDFAGAADATTRLAEELKDLPAGERAARLAEAMRHAAAFLAAFAETATSSELRVPDPRGEGDAWVVGLETGAAAALRLKVGPRIRPRTVQLSIGDLSGRLNAYFPALEGGSPTDRAAFLAWMEIARHLRAARDYLGRVRADDDASGTGKEGYPFEDLALREALRALRSETSPWARELVGEAEAVVALVKALRAFSQGRNRSAAIYTEQLLESSPNRLAVLLLR